MHSKQEGIRSTSEALLGGYDSPRTPITNLPLGCMLVIGVRRPSGPCHVSDTPAGSEPPMAEGGV